MTASFLELENCSLKKYYDLLPLSGIRRSIQKELRQLDRGFYRCSHPHPGVECLVGQISKLLTNYGCDSSLGRHLQVSMELLIIEAGVSTQILATGYGRYSGWVSPCWLKSVWEKISLFNLCVETRELPLQPPRANDKWLMVLLMEAGYTKVELIQLNRVCCHQQVIFYLDILALNGQSLDRRYLTWRPEDKMWSNLIFPIEQTAPRDFSIWRMALKDFAPWGVPRRRFDPQVGPGHKIRPARHQPLAIIEEVPTAFWQVLKKWEHSWMWDDLKWEGEDN